MKNLKKILALLLVVAMVAAMFVGCNETTQPSESGKDTTPATQPAKPDDTQKPDDTTPATEPVEPEEYEGFVSELDADGNYGNLMPWGPGKKCLSRILCASSSLPSKMRERISWRCSRAVWLLLS